MMNLNTNKTHDYFRRRLHGLFVITDYTRADLARAMCVPYNTVLQWESGEKVPDVYQFREIADFFDMPYAWFLDGTDGLPCVEEIADRLGLSEGTVEALMEMAETTPEQVLDDMDDCLFQIVTVLQSAVNKAHGGGQ